MPRWDKLTVSGSTFKEAFTAWYFDEKKIGAEDKHGPNANPTCPQPVPEDDSIQPSAIDKPGRTSRQDLQKKFTMESRVQAHAAASLYLLGAAVAAFLAVGFLTHRRLHVAQQQLVERSPCGE